MNPEFKVGAKVLVKSTDIATIVRVKPLGADGIVVRRDADGQEFSFFGADLKNHVQLL